MKENKQNPLDGRRNSRRNSMGCLFERYRIACLFGLSRGRTSPTCDKSEGFCTERRGVGKIHVRIRKERENKKCVYRFVGIGKKAKGGVIRVLQTFKIYDPDQFGSNLAPLDKKKTFFYFYKETFGRFSPLVHFTSLPRSHG
jgi:hypothetical protein